VSFTVALHVCDHAAAPLNITARHMIEPARRKRAPRRAIWFAMQKARIEDVIETLTLVHWELKSEGTRPKETLEQQCELQDSSILK
jgi:hypothetical protein